MRTDVKVGIAVALLLVIAVVSYYAIFGGGKAGSSGSGDRVASVGQVGEPNSAGDGNAAPSGPVLPRFGGVSPSPAAPPVAQGRAPDSAGPDTSIALADGGKTGLGPTAPESPTTPRIGEETVTPAAAEPPGSPAGGAEPAGPAIADASGTPTVRERPVTPVIDVVPVPPPAAIGRQPPAAEERVYVVQKGDAGFWAVAEKAYGDGRHWPLIAKANPGADSNALRPGQKLKVPPKPTASPAPGGGSGGTEPAGGLFTAPTGQRYYIVRKGDAGFWGIAQGIYGDGKHWPLIAQANPKVNSNALQPGDRLTVPPQPAGPATRAVEPLASLRLAAGDQLYVVQKDDTSGFWGIARKVYGNTAYWPVIAKANPKAGSSSLKVGQKLIVPKLTDEMRGAVPRAAAATPGTPKRAPEDVEDIGRQPVFRR